MVPLWSLRSNDSTSIINEHACISMSVVVLQLIHKQIRIITYLNLSNDLVLMEPPLLRDWSLAEADLLEEKKTEMRNTVYNHVLDLHYHSKLTKQRQFSQFRWNRSAQIVVRKKDLLCENTNKDKCEMSIALYVP